ncbi:hypothetical protein EJB05_45621, partial [Eragrostis curvula]
MLHLQKHLGGPFRHQWLLSFNRFATTAASTASPDPAPFAIEDYLVATCGLSRDKAVKASKQLSHLKSPSKPDAVLAFLSGLGLPPSDIATTVARQPSLLCSKVEKTPHSLQFYIPLFGSFDNLLLALKKNSYLLGANLERVVKPNLSLLSEYGLGAHEISKFCLKAPTLLTVRPARVWAMAAFVEDMGIPRGKLIFWHALRCFTNISKESVTAKIELLKRIFRCSEPEVIIVLSKTPALLTNSEDRMCHVSGFLFSEAGLDPAYVACHPALMTYSLEGRLMPRFYVVKFLKETGSLGQHRSYYAAVAVKEKDFVERYIQPYMEAAPHLAEDYAAACRGQVPSRFRSQESRTGLTNA